MTPGNAGDNPRDLFKNLLMKIGDKVKVTYTDGDQLIGRIVGETAKMWTVDFDGEEKTRKIRKSMKIELIDDPKTPEKEVISVPSEEKNERKYPKDLLKNSLEDYRKKQARSINWRMTLIIGATLLLAATAILVGLGYLNMGAEGIYFSF